MLQKYTKRGRYQCSISTIKNKFKDHSIQRDHNCYFKHTNNQLKPTLKIAVGFVFRRKKFLPSFSVSGPTNINRIYTFQDVPIDSCGYVSMSIFYYFSYQSTLLLSSLSDLRSHVLSPFIRFTGDHFGVDNKENGDHFGVGLGTLFRVGHNFGVQITSGAAQNQTVSPRY